ncbi:MAG: RluA family pseudouridine synthase [Bacillota bacterium]
MEERNFTVKKGDNNKRIDKFLAQKNNDLSRSYIQNLINNGRVEINNKNITKKSYKITNGDNITIVIPPPEDLNIKPVEMDLDVLYEDKDIIVVNKPAGLVVHPAPGNRNNTLVHGLLAHTDKLSGINGIKRPGIVHRLDKDTSGVLVVAKNDKSHRKLVDQFKKRKVKKIYKTVVKGKLSYKKGKIDAPIGRDPDNRKKMAVRKNNSKNAVTLFKVIEYFNNYSLVEIELKTGRTHQIRVHFAYMGHPVVGDKKYGNSKSEVKRQLLHAYKLEFLHPGLKEKKSITSPLPEEFDKFIKKIKNKK